MLRLSQVRDLNPRCANTRPVGGPNHTTLVDVLAANVAETVAAPELNPTELLDIHEATGISLIAAAARKVALSFYTV